ncbi:carbohydrate-binding protein [Streptomyces luteogriseus]|uniref:carbohydrate-binding protein n=1 Tax=Streptomyces luteogriseus TaxID=68233 RepID=UPI003794A6AB
MALYGLSLYGEDYYGRDVVVSYSVGDVVAEQSGYNQLTIRWTTPISRSDWGNLRLVRNTHGYPSSETDGDVILEFRPDNPQNSVTDAELVGGRFYYYAVFLSSAFPAYSSTDIYQAGDTVSFNGNNWICIVDNTFGVEPSTSAAQWQASNAVALWNRAGQACSLAIADCGYRSRLYRLLPLPYASAQEDITSPEEPTNDLLARFLSVLAWGLDMARTELGEQQHLHRVETMPLYRMELLARQLGVDSEASITPRLRRGRIARAADLGRRRGTVEAIKESIYVATGWDSEITPSTNLMMDADQAEAYNPRFPAWDPSVSYQAGAVVSYNGYLYKASSNTVRLEAETQTITLNGAPSYSTQGNTTTAKYSNNQQILVKSNAINQAVTFTFSVPSTGSYDLAVGMTKSFDYGITNFAVDGTTVRSDRGSLIWPPQPLPLAFDGYAKSASPATSVYLGKYDFTAGNHTLKITVVRKNASSSGTNNGYQFGVDYLTYTPRGANSSVGIPPSGSTSNNAFWTYYTAQISNVLDNPLTGGVTLWGQKSFTAGATANNDYIDVYSGYKALSGIGDNQANLLVMSNSTGSTATLAAHSIPHARVSAWDANSAYPIGAYVSYDGDTYIALLPTQGNAPDADRVHWRPEAISTSGTDRFLVSAFGIPLTRASTWTGGTQYSLDDVVQHQGQIYRATQASWGTPPTGGPTDSSVWAWVRSAQEVYTASAYTSRFSGTGTPTRSLYIEWYDASGNLITTINPSTVGPNPDLLVPFTRNSSDVSTDPAYKDDIAGIDWLRTGTDIPVASSGMCYWGTRASNQTATGRHLSLQYARADNVSVGVTFMTAPPPGVEHGFTFRRSDASNCWSVSRTRLAKIVAGTVTAVASWSTRGDGSRLYAQLSGNNIRVFAYQGPGLAPLELANVTDAFNATATEFGLFERIY